MRDVSDTTALAGLAPRLRACFELHDYSIEGLAKALGPQATAALNRSDAAGVRRSAVRAGSVGNLARLFILGDELPRGEVEALLGTGLVSDGISAGLLVGDDLIRADLDLRPVDLGDGNACVFSDTDGAMAHRPTRPDHVLGVGQASLSLLNITPSSAVPSVLDLGTGCGVQLLNSLSVGSTGVGTDITPRCLDFAAATLAINERAAELLAGPWFDPVADRKFDRIVANPPFVVGTPEVGHTYRESGLELDGASETVISGAPRHLAPGGTAVMLASWVVRRDEDWRHRVSSWLPQEGVDAWVIQRDVSDPELYVWTWLTDEGLDPREDGFATEAEQWLAHFAANRVTGIGFGYVFVRSIDGPSSVLCEDLPHPFDSGLGDEAEAYFARNAWLREQTDLHGGDEAAVLDSTVFAVAPHVHVHESIPLLPPTVEEPDPVIVVERTTGPRWRHEIDSLGRSLLLGMRSGVLPLSDLVAIAALAANIDPEKLSGPARSAVSELFRHGIVIPAGVRGLTQKV